MTDFAAAAPVEDLPVPGERTTLDAVQPTPEQVDAGRDRAKSRTAHQAFTGTMVLTPLVWFLRMRGVDLNPLPGETEIPGEVAFQLGALVTYLAAVWMNRRR